eukprot:EG_transcript_3115
MNVAPPREVPFVAGPIAVWPKGNLPALSLLIGQRFKMDGIRYAMDIMRETPVVVDGLYCPSCPYVPRVVHNGRHTPRVRSKSMPPEMEKIETTCVTSSTLAHRPRAIRHAVVGTAQFCTLCLRAFGPALRRIRCPSCGRTCCPHCCCSPLAVEPHTRPCYPCRRCVQRGGPEALAWSWSDYGIYEDRLFESMPTVREIQRVQHTYPNCVTCSAPVTSWRQRYFCHVCRLPVCRSCRGRTPKQGPPICESCNSATDLMRYPTAVDLQVEACALCRKSFTFFRARNRCRHCGAIVCPACCPEAGTPSTCRCMRCAQPLVFRFSDDVLRYVLSYLGPPDLGNAFGTCRRLQSLVVLPFNAIERLEDFYAVDWTENLLGEGAFGKVYSCVSLRTGKKCAVKIIPKNKITSYGKAGCLMREIEIHSGLNHPHTVALYETVQNDQAIFMLMGLAGDSVLSDLILSRGRLREWQAASIVLQVLEFLKYLHEERHVVHRDLKPDNLVLCASDGRLTGEKRGARRSDAHVRVVDFGLARFIGPPPAMQWHDPDIVHALEANKALSALQVAKHPELALKCTPCGTLRYCAPEVLVSGSANKPVYHGNIPKRDLWSVGVLAFLMLSGRLPHKAKTVKELQVEMRRPLPMSGRRWNTVSSEGRAFIQWLCALDPFQRPTAAEAMQHAWFRRMVPLAPSCLRHCACVGRLPSHAAPPPTPAPTSACGSTRGGSARCNGLPHVSCSDPDLPDGSVPARAGRHPSRHPTRRRAASTTAGGQAVSEWQLRRAVSASALDRDVPRCTCGTARW